MVTFNTGRKYSAEGQIISATRIVNGGVGIVYFMDKTRRISGKFASLHGDVATETMRHYDACDYTKITMSEEKEIFGETL
jgi:hypothetical protein